MGNWKSIDNASKKVEESSELIVKKFGESADAIMKDYRTASSIFKTTMVSSTCVLAFTAIYFRKILYKKSLWFFLYFIQTGDDRRRSIFNSVLNIDGIEEPEYYPLFVVQHNILNDIEQNLSREGGLRILWGPRGSGKTSYTLHACNKLLKEKKISGVIRCKCIPYYEKDHDAGTSWFNETIGVQALKRGYQISKELLPKSDKRKHLKKIVFLFDQVDNIIPSNTSEDVLKAFNTHITNLAEDAQYSNTYTVVMCMRNPYLAKQILRLNGGSKISHMGLYALQHKWSDEQINQFVPNTQLKSSVLPLCQSAGTPQFCIDALSMNEITLKQQAQELFSEWEAGSKIIDEALLN